MSDALDLPLNRTDLNRLDLDSLIRAGEQALRAGQYRRAASLLREAVRRAPFRQDLRELMAAAIEGSADSSESESRREPAPRRRPEPVQPSQPEFIEPVDERPEPRIVSRPVRPRRPQQPIDFFDEPAQTDRPHRYEPEIVQPEPERPAQPMHFERPAEPVRPEPPTRNENAGRGIAFGRRPADHRLEPKGRRGAPKPAQFNRRHNRGPVSALLLTFIVGIVFVAAAAGGIYWYMQQVVTPDGSTSNPTQKHESDYEVATTYKNNRQFSQALEVLNKLPQTPRRDHMIAEIYMAQADVSLAMKPPALESALDSIKQAVHFFPENADYGILEGDVYYNLGLIQQQDRPAKAREYFDQARQSFDRVVQQNPDNLKALLKLGDVAGKLGDAVTQANSYDKIIRINPGSEQADIARRNKRSLNYRN